MPSTRSRGGAGAAGAAVGSDGNFLTVQPEGESADIELTTEQGNMWLLKISWMLK